MLDKKSRETLRAVAESLRVGARPRINYRELSALIHSALSDIKQSKEIIDRKTKEAEDARLKTENDGNEMMAEIMKITRKYASKYDVR